MTMPALPVPPVWASGIHPQDTVQRRERDEPKTQTEQINAGEFQEFSYVSPQQRRENTSKGTTALSFPTEAVAIISIHLRTELAFQ